MENTLRQRDHNLQACFINTPSTNPYYPTPWKDITRPWPHDSIFDKYINKDKTVYQAININMTDAEKLIEWLRGFLDMKEELGKDEVTRIKEKLKL